MTIKKKILVKEGLKIFRDENGIPHVEADVIEDVYWGQGYVHGTDRGLQLILMRILAQGRASEILDSSDETLEIDIFFRKMNWTSNIDKQIKILSTKEIFNLNSYCKGINAALIKRLPWEMKLLGYKFEPWKIEDCIVLSRMLGYLTLAQSQAEMERLFVELVHAGISYEKLEELFSGILGGFDLELLRKVKINERIVSPVSLWSLAIPRMMASNNWVVSGSKTASGMPMLCNDPHLEINRLPGVWCEIILKKGKSFMTGGSIPGLPGVLTGRTEKVSWGVTYAFVDAIDSWIEKCGDGKYYREDGQQWIDFNQRKEVIQRKNKKPFECVFFENDHGLLDGDPNKKGLYLATKWAAADSGGITLSAILKMWDIDTVDEAMDVAGSIETGWSLVMADKKGDIGFQMSGKVPLRRKGVSGFVPLPGWVAENDWKGFLNIRDLPRIKNPSSGYFATSNQDLNEYGIAHPINMPMGKYRSDRVGCLLEEKANLTKDDMYLMHRDVYSIQAEIFMKILKPLLPDTPQGEILRKWDFKYDSESKGAFLFEKFYKQLYLEIFGKNGFGESIIDFLEGETGVFIDFYNNFDKVLLSKNSLWFGEKTREEIYRTAALKALKIEPEKWGVKRKFMMTHLLFGGKLPSFLGFDKGPVQSIGGRATINQGQIYKSAGRTTTFMPSIRVVIDMADKITHTNMPGGPSDRRFSKWYCSDLKNWLEFKYKILDPDFNG